MPNLLFFKKWNLFFGLTEREDKAGCFHSRNADEDACVAVKIEHSRGMWHLLLHLFCVFSFFLSVRPSIWRYFSTDSTSEWLFGRKVLTAHLFAYTRCCICQGSCRCLLLAQWIIGLQLWIARGRLLVCNLHQEPWSPTPVWQHVLILLSLKQDYMLREDLWGGWCEDVKQPVLEGIFLIKLVSSELIFLSFDQSPRSPCVQCCSLTCCISSHAKVPFSPFDFFSSLIFQNKDHSSLPISQCHPPAPPLHFLSH